MSAIIGPDADLTDADGGGDVVRFEPTIAYGRVHVAAPDDVARYVCSALLGQRFESAAHIAVCRDGRLVGVARIEDLLAADPATQIRELMDRDPPVVAQGADEEVAAWKAVRHRESALAVVDGDNQFLGLIPPRRIVEVLLSEHDEDLARLGGYLASTASARHATEERVMARLGHRLPWLLVGLAGSIAAAGVMGAAEDQLSRNVLLAFFVPGIVYMADAVGTQTEALVTRGLSVGIPVRRIVRRELFTGTLIGIALAVAFLPVGRVLWHETDVALAVSLALLAACSTATVVAMTLPWLFNWFGRDPAFGSGPLATVIQDLMSLAVYFAVASAVVG